MSAIEMASPGESPSGDEMKKQSQESHAQSTTPPLAQTPEPELHVEDLVHDIPPSPEEPSSFDWDDFERRYEQALRDADAREREILKESESLSKYFRAWASAASAHDDERAVKRLQTRSRYVNLSENKMTEKQQHYEEVVRAFESALALLRSR